mgnify:CR=1 FL=1
MSNLAQWFAGIESQPPSPDTSPPASRHPEPVAVFAGAPAIAQADPLALPWCGDYPQEMQGGQRDAAGRLPMPCLGCTSLQQGRCTVLAGVPGHEEAARCRRFTPLPGVRVGRCWLWRVQLGAGRLVWWGCLPPAPQAAALAWARSQYGEAVQGVYPVPGALSVPG